MSIKLIGTQIGLNPCRGLIQSLPSTQPPRLPAANSPSATHFLSRIRDYLVAWCVDSPWCRRTLGGTHASGRPARELQRHPLLLHRPILFLFSTARLAPSQVGTRYPSASLQRLTDRSLPLDCPASRGVPTPTPKTSSSCFHSVAGCFHSVAATVAAPAASAAGTPPKA